MHRGTDFSFFALISGMLIGAIASIALPALPSHAGFKPPGDLDKPGNRRGLATRLHQPPQRGPLNETTPQPPDRVAPPRPIVPPIWPVPAPEPLSQPTPSQEKNCVASQQPPLTLLVPKSNIGLSASASPTFYWFTPSNSFKFVQFRLYKMDRFGNPIEEVYGSKFQSSGKAGLSWITLPHQKTMFSLLPGVDYQWQVKLYCSQRQQKGLEAQGWIRFVPPQRQFLEKLRKTNPQDHYDVYAEAGYWYDTLQELATSRQAQPDDPRLQQAWKSLLESKPVQLPEIAAQ
jgi:hypothetical protein